MPRISWCCVRRPMKGCRCGGSGPRRAVASVASAAELPTLPLLSLSAEGSVGQKVHPIGFRLGISQQPQAKWYAGRLQFAETLGEDLKIRGAIAARLKDAGVPRVDIERSTNQVSVTIHAAK